MRSIFKSGKFENRNVANTSYLVSECNITQVLASKPWFLSNKYYFLWIFFNHLLGSLKCVSKHFLFFYKMVASPKDCKRGGGAFLNKFGSYQSNRRADIAGSRLHNYVVIGQFWKLFFYKLFIVN